MPANGRHLLFYDGQCGLCDQCVQLLLKVDYQKRFVFAPLQGETAAQKLAGLPPHLRGVDSLVLIENYQTDSERTYVMSRGVWRICWLLGGLWTVLGWLSFLPGWLLDWAYRFVARNRHRIFPQTSCVVPDPKQRERFLS